MKHTAKYIRIIYESMGRQHMCLHPVPNHRFVIESSLATDQVQISV